MSEETPREDHESVRRDKLAKIAALGLDPWGRRFDDHLAVAEVRALPLPEGDPAPAGPRVRIAGRIMPAAGTSSWGEILNPIYRDPNDCFWSPTSPSPLDQGARTKPSTPVQPAG